MRPLPIANPQNPWHRTEIEYLEEPPDAGLHLYDDKTKNVLSENDSPDIGFRWSLNPYRGCMHACAYCYARPFHEYLGFGAGTDFDRHIVVKRDAARLLRETFERPTWKGELIVFSGATDCYQPIEATFGITRACLEVCRDYRNPVSIITKSPTIERDIDVLTALAERTSVRICVSIPFFEPEKARAVEPYVATPERRFRIIERLAKAGLDVGVNVAPLIPGLSDEEVPRILKAAHDAGARKAHMVLLRLPGPVKQVFEARLRANFPLRAEKVLARIRDTRSGQLNDPRFGSRWRGEGEYADILSQLFRKHAARLGLAVWEPMDPDAMDHAGFGANGGGLGSTFRRPTDRGGQLRLLDNLPDELDNHIDFMPGVARPSIRERRPRAYSRAVAPRLRSSYLPMPDGTALAADLWLPEANADRRGFPTILRQTRYYRRVARKPLGRWVPPETFDLYASTRQRFLAAGYAWLDVDVRGTGASFGRWALPWSRDEGRDGHALVDWIHRQPWSDGTVGLLGVSYDGTTAEQTAAEGHPAVRALAARFSVWDVYADVAFPGGLFHEWFLRSWGGMNQSLDRHAMGEAFALLVQISARGLGAAQSRPTKRQLLESWRLHEGGKNHLLRGVFEALIDGVAPVDDDVAARQRASSRDGREHNFDVYAGARRIACRDDVGVFPDEPTLTIDGFSPHRRRAALEQTGIPILSESGWFDGSYARAAIHRFQQVRTPGSQLLLGPWDHGGKQTVFPDGHVQPTRFDHDAELLRFFGMAFGRPDTIHPAPRVRYFQFGENAWKSADNWPPANTRAPLRWTLGAGRRLVPSEPPNDPSAGRERLIVDPSTGTGHRTRWRSLVGLALPTAYPDRDSHAERGLCFTSAPLTEELTLLGSPRFRGRFAADGPDAAVFVYLDWLPADATASPRLLTEGWLRLSLRGDETAPFETDAALPSFVAASRRWLTPGAAVVATIELLPIAVRLAAGDRLRLVFTGADVDHFEAVTSSSSWTIAYAEALLSLPRA
jgi:uncharacterized protein